MSNFKEGVIEKLQELEAEIKVFDAYLVDRTRRKEDLQVVHMRAFFDLIAFKRLHAYAPEYIPGDFVAKKLAQELSTVADYVSVVNNEVVISPAYDEFLAVKANYLKNGK